MSEILNLARSFEKKSREKATSIERELQSEYEKHAAHIRRCLSESASTLQADILKSHQRLRWVILRGWMWLLISLLFLLIALGGLTWWTGEVIKDNVQIILKQQDTKAQLDGLQDMEIWTGSGKITLLLPKGWIAKDPFTSEGRVVVLAGTKKAMEE